MIFTLRGSADPMNQERGETCKADILVVDDMPDNIRLLSAILTRHGYAVRKALNAQMALKAVQADLPDIILLDINMPQMNGYQLCEQLKANEFTREVPIIFISALDDVFDKVKAFEVGGVDYITKPFQDAEVLARIANQIKLRSLQIQVQKKNILLEKTLADLQKAQTQLVQNEKMIGLGQLVAGLAHEINNPVSFIYGNLSHVSEYTSELLRLVKLYQDTFPNVPSTIQDVEAEIDLEFLWEDLEKLLGSMKGGADRIRAIIESLRNFSRLDEAPLKAVNLHEGIESTLTLLQHRLNGNGARPAIAVVKDYGELPQVECYAGQINQVFMNILSNGIDAVEFVRSEERKVRGKESINTSPCICIRTSTQGDRVSIKISDNGSGIPDDVKQRIFDPFFTTKPVGSGTGMGLSIAYQIVVEGHGGELWCESKPGEGTTFIISLPINHPDEDAMSEPPAIAREVESAG